MASKIKICLTGGPCAGKTTVVDIVRREFSQTAVTIPEAASILYGGGFPRFQSAEGIKSAQRAIYYTQVEMEKIFELMTGPQVLFCDRGTLDHPAYWPLGDSECFFKSVNSSIENEVNRYHLVIHLQSAKAEHGYQNLNAVRKESPDEALLVDQRILESWKPHPQRVIIPSTLTFQNKIDTVFQEIEAFLKGRQYESIFRSRNSKRTKIRSVMDNQERQIISGI